MAEVNTEEQIFASIDANESGTTPVTPATTGEDDAPSESAKPVPAASGTEDGQPDSAVSKSGKADKSGKPGAGKDGTENKSPAPTAQARNPGDLTDANGNLLARAGAERRVFERAVHHTKGLFEQELTQLRTKVQSYETALQAPMQMGLGVDEIATAYRLVKAIKDKPVETIKQLLTELQAAGHTIDGIGHGTDTAAIRAMIEAELKPFKQDREQTVQRTQVDQDIANQVNAFYGKYPDAVVHESDLAALLDDDPSLSPDAAYWRLQSFAHKNGFDWTQPLGPQVRARAQAAQNGGGNGGSRIHDVPNGRSATAAPLVERNSVARVAPEAQSSKDTVRQIMREMGMIQ